MKNMKKMLILTIVLIGAFAYFSRSKPSNENILVSANLPLTGDLAVYGQYIKQGSELAYSDLRNDYKNVPDLVFDWQDNMGDLGDTVSIFHQQVAQKPDLYISGLKPSTAVITDLVSQNNIPHFNWTLDVKINERSTNNLRTLINFKQEAAVFVDYLKEKKPEKVYMVYVNLESAVGEYEGVVRPALLEMGLKNENIISEPFNLTRTDFRDIALKIKQVNPDYLIINGFIPHVVSMTKEFRNLGVMTDTNTMASIDMLDAALLLSPQEVEGVFVAAPQYLVDRDNVSLNAWKKHFEDTYKRVPTYFDAYAYDMVRIILEASEELTLPAKSEDWIKAIRAVETIGVTGSIKFDDDGSLITSMYPAVYRGGELISLE